MADDVRNLKKIAVWNYNSILMTGFFSFLFIFGSIMQYYFTYSQIPLEITPPIVAYTLALTILSLGIVSLISCFVVLVLWIFTFKKYLNRETESHSKNVDRAYSIAIFFITVAILQNFFSFLGQFDFSQTCWEFKLSVIIASLGLVSLGVCFGALLKGAFSFKKYVDEENKNKEKKFKSSTFTGTTLLFLTISSVPISFLAFGWLGLILECLFLLIPFYLCFGTERIIKIDKS